MKVLDLVKNKTAKFIYYRDKELWYSIVPTQPYGPDAPKAFTFPVPISDTGSGIFEREMKAIHLMRWINKHLDTHEKWNKERSRIKEEVVVSKDEYFKS